ncbi:DNA-binding response regulator [Malaciobacter molluscorum LMG 25693]|uniref:DNA-binding response regulator n=1 Tax=Malaciobacter molluscorum LMG 25693 TaxID=870501 RepID=A0A2G1DH88_9BACT|nr:DNA-binding response regulator [Malaciobacter molluscorum LMG 25693]
MLKILYVEDDEIARVNAVEFLEDYFESIYSAKDGLEALSLYEKFHPDIIITDIQMPKINGLEFIKKVRKNDLNTQIIIISAYSTKDYLLQAVELRLIKYLIKPIKFDELLKVIEESKEFLQNNSSNIINFCDNLTFDMFNKVVKRDNTLIKITMKELLLLELLLKNKNRYVTYQEIENYVWADDMMSKDALKSLIKRLKNTLECECINNLSGYGYKIDV